MSGAFCGGCITGTLITVLFYEKKADANKERDAVHRGLSYPSRAAPSSIGSYGGQAAKECSSPRGASVDQSYGRQVAQDRNSPRGAFFDPRADDDEVLRPGDVVLLKGFAAKAFDHQKGVVVESYMDQFGDESPGSPTLSPAMSAAARVKIQLGSGKPVSVKIDDLCRIQSVVFVEHIPPGARPDAIKDVFRNYGDIERIDMDRVSDGKIAVYFERPESSVLLMKDLRCGSVSVQRQVVIGRWHCSWEPYRFKPISPVTSPSRSPVRYKSDRSMSPLRDRLMNDRGGVGLGY